MIRCRSPKLTEPIENWDTRQFFMELFKVKFHENPLSVFRFLVHVGESFAGT